MNNKFAGLTASPLSYQFAVPDIVPPTVLTYSPAQAATGQSKSANVVLTFSEWVQVGTGNIVLTPSGGNQPNVATLVAVTSSEVTIVDNVVTINPTNDLQDQGGKTYTVTLVSGVILDGSPNGSLVAVVGDPSKITPEQHRLH